MDKTIDFQNRNSFSGLVVLPTGGGKTITAVQWVLENMINNNKKVLWIAHRYELLEQALSAVKRSAFSNLLTIRNSFDYRLISGRHDSVGNIKETDDLIIASKDSLSRKMKQLTKSWLNDNSEVCLVIDEAHHATAKTYRKIMSCLKENVKKLWIIGLTATPFRTDGQEKGNVFVNNKLSQSDYVKSEPLEIC
ncbi:MAG: DEAD/DEAH box helicase family protein [Bacillaceae bacterium]|nr:DEAD/DEAH box helicase family protein [Bacillaceae bacterium]